MCGQRVGAVEEDGAFEAVRADQDADAVRTDLDHVGILEDLLALEEDVGVQRSGGDGGVLGGAVVPVDGVADPLDGVLVDVVGAGGDVDGGGQQPVDDDVGVATDGRGEVGVDVLRQAVVREVGGGDGTRGEVDGLVHLTGHQDAQERIEEGVLALRGVQRSGERLGRREVELDAGVRELLVEIGQQRLLWLGVPAEQREGRVVAQDLGGDGDVGQEHELFNQVVGL